MKVLWTRFMKALSMQEWTKHEPIRWTRNRPPDTQFNISLTLCLFALEIRLPTQRLLRGAFARLILQKDLHEIQALVILLAVTSTWRTDNSPPFYLHTCLHTFSVNNAYIFTIFGENVISTLIMYHCSALLLNFTAVTIVLDLSWLLKSLQIYP